LLKYQITQFDSPGLYGGIISPAYARIEGRCGDAVYPFMHMAKKTGDTHYLDGALRVMRWSGNNVFFPDGSVVMVLLAKAAPVLRTFWKQALR
jgi:hypothetical protein